jgi:hypothetical protein
LNAARVRHLGERGQVADLDRGISYALVAIEETAAPAGQLLRNPTDPESHHVRTIAIGQLLAQAVTADIEQISDNQLILFE